MPLFSFFYRHTSHSKSLFIPIIAIVLLGIMNTIHIQWQTRQLSLQFEHHIHELVSLANTFILEDLLKEDYQAIEQSLQLWGRSNPNIIELLLFEDNQQVILTHYKKDTAFNTPQYPLYILHDGITTTFFTLTIKVTQIPLQKAINDVRIYYSLTYIIIITLLNLLFLFYLMK